MERWITDVPMVCAGFVGGIEIMSRGAIMRAKYAP